MRKILILLFMVQMVAIQGMATNRSQAYPKAEKADSIRLQSKVGLKRLKT